MWTAECEPHPTFLYSRQYFNQMTTIVIFICSCMLLLPFFFVLWSQVSRGSTKRNLLKQIELVGNSVGVSLGPMLVTSSTCLLLIK